MGKLVKEDLARPATWPSLPNGLSIHVASYASTKIVCTHCGSPIGGLVYVPETDHFEHRDRKMCLTKSSR